VRGFLWAPLTYLINTDMRINEVILHEELLDVKSVITSPIKKLDKVFKSNNYELRIVGGAVRDLALDKTPKDIDLATDATPEEMTYTFWFRTWNYHCDTR
jgi:hypothetical protein